MKLCLSLAVCTVLIGLAFGSIGYDDSNKDDGYYSRSGYGGHAGYGHGYGYDYKVTCPKLENPENGRVRLTGLHPGSRAIHICREGHILNGVRVRKCQSDGSWSDEAPTCDPVDCGDPDTPDENGSVEVDDTTYLNIATYSCNPGFKLVEITGGSEVVTCLASGEWSDTAPSCMRIECHYPPAPVDNGAISFTTTNFESTAVYTCDAGYTLPGGVSQVVSDCQSDGTWSVDPAPSCSPINCGPPPAANANGAVSVEPDTNEFRSIATYTCNYGFVLDTSNGGSPYLVCQSNRAWSGIAPNCERVECGVVETPENGEVNSSPDTQLASVTQISCIRGYNLTGGDATRQCQADGTWSGQQPYCERIECPVLEDPANGKVRVSGQYVDDVAIYRCAYGHILKGESKRRVCQENGAWSGTAPTCEADKYYGRPSYGHGFGYGGPARIRRPHFGYGDDKKDY